ncbi:MAG TPA: hypothetical protein VKA30_00270, partial [Actinomycetota bacterium]|nr:hypothetical protein [Actinomycetota bacterium]
TVRSRTQEIAFPPLTEAFVVQALVGEGVDPDRALLVCRLSGGNLGRARRLARPEGLAFRDAALAAGNMARGGPREALAAADALLAAAKDFRGVLAEELKEDLLPFVDEKGRPEEAFRGVVRRLQEQHERRLRRAEREFLDSALLALAADYRDRVAVGSGGGRESVLNVDRVEELSGEALDAPAAAVAMGAVEEARAHLADETNLNSRLILERLFLRLAAL